MSFHRLPSNQKCRQNIRRTTLCKSRAVCCNWCCKWRHWCFENQLTVWWIPDMHCIRRISSCCRSITSLCCDNTFVLFVSAGIDVRLFKTSFEWGQWSLTLQNDEKMDALAAFCYEKSVTLSNSKDGFIIVF